MAADKKAIRRILYRLSSAACTAAAVMVCLLSMTGCSGGAPAVNSDNANDNSTQTVSVPGKETSVQEENISEENEKALSALKIKLVFDDKTETIDRDVFSLWTEVSQADGKLRYIFDDAKLRTFVHSLAKKYNTFNDDIWFTDHTGNKRRVKNMSIGWLMNEAYTANMLKEYIKNGESTEVILTDGSKESKKWWTRYAADYDYDKKKGDTFAEVSISDQYMWVVKDGEVILEADIVSGTYGTPSATPKGGYYVFEKLSPCTLSGIGWEVQVSYWIAFNFDIGFHDAYWQDSFGGDTYYENGSHGCVNLPLYAAETLYSIAYLNMPVYVY